MEDILRRRRVEGETAGPGREGAGGAKGDGNASGGEERRRKGQGKPLVEDELFPATADGFLPVVGVIVARLLALPR